jgi:hypothetical protein
MKTFAVLGATVLIASSASAQSAPQWSGFSVVRTLTAAGNSQYKIYGNWNANNIVMLNALDFGVNNGSPAQFGTMNARHQDAGEDADGNPLASWSANVNLLGATARDNDSWVTTSGSGTSGGNDTSLDPSFSYPAGSTDRSFIPLRAGWFDATPGTVNPVLAGGQGGHLDQNATGGFQMLLMQIVREGDDETNGLGLARFHLKTGFKLASTTQALFGIGSFTIGVPAPGALALLGLAGAFGRRRR